MSVDVIPPGQRRRIAVIGSGNKRMLSREGLAQMLCETASFCVRLRYLPQRGTPPFY